MKSLLLTAFAALSLAACDASATAPQTAAPAPAPATTDVTPDSFKMPTGEGCAGDVARYRAIMANDLSMGHVAKSVYNQIEKEIGEADAQCAAGHEAQARATIVASRKRHGYPGDL
jgi:cytochrome c1